MISFLLEAKTRSRLGVHVWHGFSERAGQFFIVSDLDLSKEIFQRKQKNNTNYNSNL